MRWGIRNQILWPFAVVLLAAVAGTAIASAWMAAERSEREIAERQTRVLRTLGRSNFPWSQNVLELMRGLSGAEFVVWDGGTEPTASTLPEATKLDASFRERIRFESNRSDVADAAGIRSDADGIGRESLAERSLVEAGDRRYFAAGFRRISPRGLEQTLVVLYPEEQLLTARREAALPPLIVGGLTLVVMAIVAAWLASRIGRRIRTVQEQVALIAGGDFREMPSGTTRDEIFALVQSVNQMATKLRGFQETIERTERSRLLGQLAGGLAHQLRNAVTGARLAIQLHQRRCDNANDRDSLAVALRQLELTEEHVKSLLSVGKHERREPLPRLLSDVLDDVAALVSPVCRHEHIDFLLDASGALGPEDEAASRDRQGAGSAKPYRLNGPLPDGRGSFARQSPSAIVSDSEAVRTAVLNLVLNAVDAAGPNGEITVRSRHPVFDEHRVSRPTVTIEVLDNGPGPPEELGERLFEPFVTGKLEGVGLGLALVKQVADDLGGRVSWERIDGRTVFRLCVPTVGQAFQPDPLLQNDLNISSNPGQPGKADLLKT